jgi:hypothetical protein
MAPVEGIREAVSALWAAPPDDGVTPRRSVAFPDLLAACGKINPRVNDGFAVLALENALRSLGPPWMRVGNVQPLAPSPTEAAHRLVTSLVATQGRRRHLCPLDGADRLPAWSFGPNRVVQFSPAELDSIVGPARLLRHHQRWSFDTQAFAQVQWLAVDEDVALDPNPSVRAVPIFGSIIGEVDGRISPHAGRLPTAVEEALFALLLRPWEDVVEHAKFDWRPFRVPWVYSVDDDILASPAAPPDPTTLSWTEVALNGADGDVIDVERPAIWPLDAKEVGKWSALDDVSWHQFKAAQESSLLAQRPVSHFVTRGFFAEGIDEFLAHITAVEAALALPRDHYREPGKSKRQTREQAHPGQPVPWRPKLSDGSDPGATDRLNLRIAALLGSGTSQHEFSALYSERSDFIHGASMPAGIPVRQRLAARRLARNVVAEIVSRAGRDAGIDRDTFLSSLCP